MEVCGLRFKQLRKKRIYLTIWELNRGFFILEAKASCTSL